MDTYELPETGGIGTTGYLTGGAILMMSSCLLGGYRMRRKRKGGMDKSLFGDNLLRRSRNRFKIKSNKEKKVKKKEKKE